MESVTSRRRVRVMEYEEQGPRYILAIRRLSLAMPTLRTADGIADGILSFLSLERLLNQ